jgi:hypothetical protein
VDRFKVIPREVADVTLDSHFAQREQYMRDFICPKCGQDLTFENSLCLSCGSAVGFSVDDMALLVIAPEGGGAFQGAVDADAYQLCANLYLAECNWLVEVEPVRRLCVSCRLTRTRPML